MGHFPSERWSIVTTIVSSSVSLFILFLSGAKLLTGEAFSFLTEVQVSYPLIAGATLHLIYALLLMPLTLKKHAPFAGFLNLLFVGALSVALFFTNPLIGVASYSIWLGVILLAGLYHWTLALLGGGGAIMLLLFVGSDSPTSPSSTVFTLCILTILATIGSIVLWASIKKGRIRTASHLSSSAMKTLELESLIDSIGDGVAVINKDGQIEVFNPSAATITGWTESEALGLDHRSVFALLDKAEHAYDEDSNPISQAFKTQKAIVDNSGFLTTRTKKNIDIDLLASPIMTPEQGLLGIVVIFRDVSKARSEERQRAEFISTASHEMRTPVASIEGYLALALNEKVSKIDDAGRSYLEKAHKSTQHLGRLFQDLLTAAKSEDGRLTNHPTVADMGELLDEMIHDMQFSAQEHGLTLKADFGGGMATVNNETTAPALRPVAYVHVDPERIREVITNLYDNAVKYTKEGRITISMSTSDNEVFVSISDTGVGISREDLPHLFQKFYRIDNSDTRQVGGTGLGLFICKKILDLYKGKISVESEIGKGSTFTITLPRISAEEASKMKMMEANQLNPINKDAPAPVPKLPKIEFKKEADIPETKPKREEEPKPVVQKITPAATSVIQAQKTTLQPTTHTAKTPQKPLPRPTHIDNILPIKKSRAQRTNTNQPTKPRAMATYVKVRSHPNRPPQAKIYIPKSTATQQNLKQNNGPTTKINTA